MSILLKIKRQQEKRKMKLKCQELMDRAVEAEKAGDSEYAKELIHQQVTMEIRYKENYIW